MDSNGITRPGIFGRDLFGAAYGRIILRCAERLKNNRLACFVVGDFRAFRETD